MATESPQRSVPDLLASSALIQNLFYDVPDAIIIGNHAPGRRQGDKANIQAVFLQILQYVGGVAGAHRDLHVWEPPPQVTQNGGEEVDTSRRPCADAHPAESSAGMLFHSV